MFSEDTVAGCGVVRAAQRRGDGVRVDGGGKGSFDSKVAGGWIAVGVGVEYTLKE